MDKETLHVRQKRALYGFSPRKQWKSLPETLTLNNFKSQSKEGIENRNNTEERRKEKIFKNGFYK